MIKFILMKTQDNVIFTGHPLFELQHTKKKRVGEIIVSIVTIPLV